MRLVVTENNDQSTEGILVKKDSSFLCVRLPSALIKVWHWTHVKAVKRIYKGKEFEVNLDAMQKGRDG